MLRVSTGVLQNRLNTRRRSLLTSSHHPARHHRQERRMRLHRAMLEVVLVDMTAITPPRQLLLPDTARTQRTRVRLLPRPQGHSQRTPTRPTSSPLVAGIPGIHIPSRRTLPTQRSRRRIPTAPTEGRPHPPLAPMPPQGILDTSTKIIWSIAKP
jgi:hypothetical protein